MQISRPRLTVVDPSFTTGWENRHPGIHARVAVVADLHDRPCRAVLDALRREAPDMILIAGDLTESLIPGPEEGLTRPGLALLPEAVGIAPTFYAYGNHETGAGHIKLSRTDPLPTEPLTVHPYWREKIRQSGAVLLDDDWTVFHGMVIGGLNSGLLNPGRVPAYGWLTDFCRIKGYRILVCHQPEYYDRYLRDYPIDLFVSGHAHGGQWRLFGRGVFAPDQGLFPKYTGGVHEGRLVISRGLANTAAPIPRFFNRRELVMMELV